jgi:triacylglycerol lipase
MTAEASSLYALRYPLVLIHGLGAKSTVGPFDYYHVLIPLLKKAKTPYFVADLTSFQTVEHRSRELYAQILRQFPDLGQGPQEKINLFAHSMGGLDARYVVSHMGLGADRVASVTTIGTPHRGTYLGDLTEKHLSPDTVSTLDRWLNKFGLSSAAFRQLSTHYCRETFLAQTPDIPGVAYFSATTRIADPFFLNSYPVFWLPFQILKKHEGDNDGFVPVESAKWGTHLATHYGDHYAQIGHFAGQTRGLNLQHFYDEIFGALKASGM